ncbi:hypothetical protein ECNIH5_13325 [Enterobacter cloacae]|nr:hypothetical protein ECNIH3_13375 [Enterobacter hormaechei subsp. hoffmannii ECNIH3]AIN28607.1 hypothetical protein ECR091_13310 [Enterobacter hormaechei subsp. hoffmannii ECR091]AIX59687.1 hypothetical protein ECNIH5_13325 [Enterobacter cloacae]KTJ65991.1 hypothetical protein ASU78_24535 [Enterobacter cloacae subsp. cloacae]
MFITISLFAVRLPGADNTNDLCSTFKTDRMRNHDNNDPMNEAESLPAIFTILITILSGKMPGIVKDEHRFFKPDSMFS